MLYANDVQVMPFTCLVSSVPCSVPQVAVPVQCPGLAYYDTSKAAQSRILAGYIHLEHGCKRRRLYPCGENVGKMVTVLDSIVTVTTHISERAQFVKLLRVTLIHVFFPYEW